MFYAHSTDRQDKSDWQPLKSHLEDVADKAGGFAKEFGAEQLGYAAGLLHDLGKYSFEFQQYRLTGAKIRVDHSTAGAREAGKFYDEDLSLLLGYIITGHHGGLLNFTNKDGTDSCLSIRLLQTLPDYSAYKGEISTPDLKGISLPIKPFPKKQGFAISSFIRMLFSCLVDADFLDTEKALAEKKAALRGTSEPFSTLSTKFHDHMAVKLAEAKDTPINRARMEVYNRCLEAAALPQGMFSLTVPTGGGKTLSSMGFALEHLKKYGLKRIFYVIPYTSIIEQNADVFREIFGNENVLEHHSNYDPDKDPEDYTTQEKLRLSAENWNMPIVVTTNIQFFESLFSNRVSRCRRLHNLANSVIILDEAQMLPTKLLKPCLAALSELVKNYGCTVVLCTATQPNLDGLLDERVKPVEIMHSPQELYETFRRVQATFLGVMSDVELAARLNAHKQVLCIVNTRKHARNLHRLLGSEGCYHLSAKMCPVHRRIVLDEVKARLEAKLECRLISTSLIEAGVNIDFPFVYREKCGVDSACQGAGRCNREGLLADAEGNLMYGEVYIFQSTEKYDMVPWQRMVATIGGMVLNGHKEDPISLSAVNEYFQRLYYYEGAELDSKSILPAFEKRWTKFEFPFEEVAGNFRFIPDNTQSIIIPYDKKARDLLKDLEKVKRTKFPVKYLRSLQGYTVNVYHNDFEALSRSSSIYTIADRFFVLREDSEHYLYSKDVGLTESSDAQA